MANFSTLYNRNKANKIISNVLQNFCFMSWKLTLSLFLTLSLGIVQLSGQACGDTFFDSGGPDGNYSNNESEEWTICPDEPGDLVTITFTEVDIEAGWDFMMIYSGADAGILLEPELQTPGSYSSISPDGCLTLIWTSDFTVNEGGWAATISCAEAPPCPNPTLPLVSDITIAGATFSWLQTGDVDTWDVEIVLAGEMPTGSPTLTDISDNPFTWTGGESGTEYDFYIRGQCADSEEFSNWVGPVTFATPPSCGDQFFDTGGPNGQYQTNEFETFIFCPENPGEVVVLDFTFVDVQQFDELMIYSGADAALLLEANLLEPATFTSLADDGCLVVFFDSDFFGTAEGWEATIDCIPPPPCAEPFGLSISDVTISTAVLSWNQPGLVNVWDIEVVPAGSMPTGTPTVSGITSIPYTIEGLDSGTEYDVYVRGQCENEGPVTEWVGPVSFTTIPDCGDNFYDSGGPDGQYSNNEFQTWVFCPDTPGDLVVIDFTFVNLENCCDDLQIFSGADASVLLNEDLEAPATFTSLSADGCLTVVWESDGSVLRDGWEATIDCITPPPCADPAFLTATNVTASTASLGWSQIGPVMVWDIEIVPAGTPPTGVPTVSGVTDNPYLATGLDSNTEYEFYVRGQCEGDDEFTAWIGPVAFLTSPGCGESFFDPGGPDGNYDNNVFQTWGFCPDEPGDQIIILFTLVDVESCCDELAVYNGLGTDDPIDLDIQDPGVFSSTSDDGCLTVTFDSDVSVVRQGWEAVVYCVPCVPDNIILAENVSTGFLDATTAEVQIDLLSGMEEFQIEYDTLGFPEGTGNVVPGNDELVTLTDLQEGTDYEYYIVNLCDDGTPSIRTGPFFFSTLFFADIGITGLVAPDDGCGLGLEENVRVAITNFGQDPQTLFPLNFSVNGVLAGVSQPNDGFYTGIISRDSTREFEFDISFDFDLPGSYIVQLWTEMETDGDRSNDTLTIELNKFPPLYEDFENGLPEYMSAAPGTNWRPALHHNNLTALMSLNLDSPGDTFTLDLPAMGPMQLNDTLLFDYRYVDWAFGDSNGSNPTEDLTEEDVLSVSVSLDCGETFELLFEQPGTNHEPTVDLRTIAIPLGEFAGETIVVRISGAYSSGFGEPDYWLDVDNINLRRCSDFFIDATIDNPVAGMDNGQIVLNPRIGVGPFEYLWNTGETTGTLSNLTPGEYTVTVSDRGGCSTMATFLLEAVNTDELSELLIGNLLVAPNPAPDQTQIRVNFAETVDAQIEVVSTLGQRMWSSPMFRNVDSLDERIDISQLPDGIYFLQVQAGGQRKTVRLVKAN